MTGKVLKIGGIAIAVLCLGFGALLAAYADDWPGTITLLLIFGAPLCAVLFTIKMIGRLKMQTAEGGWSAARTKFNSLPTWRKILAIVVVVVTLPATAYWAWPDGPFDAEAGRREYAESVKTACFTKQRASPQNQNVSDAVLTSYCSCVGDGVAKSLTNKELELIGTNYDAVRDVNRAKSAAAGQMCLASVAK